MLAWAGKEARDAMAPGFKLWYDAYVDCLAGLRLRNALRRARPRPGGLATDGPTSSSRGVGVLGDETLQEAAGEPGGRAGDGV